MAPEPRASAERAFERWLDLAWDGSAPAPQRYLEDQPAELRPFLAELFREYERLRASWHGAGSGLQAGRRIGDYLLVRELGRGGAGVVWEGRQISIPRAVALKFLAPALARDAGQRGRLEREARAAGRIQHRAVVQVIALEQAGELSFLVEELIPGGRTLAHLLHELGGAAELPAHWWRTVAELFAEVGEALAAAHEAGVIHRDLKPGNLLLDPSGRPRISDFGIARVLEEPAHTRTGHCPGTPFYASPEQAAGRTDVGPASDVYSLGATFYEALTLRRPFAGENLQQVLSSIQHDDPPPPRRLRPSVPRDLEVICLKALEKKPAARFAGAAELAAELRRWLAHEPIRSRPPSPLGRAVRWCRRHPVASATSALGALSAVLLLVLLVRTEAARRRADQEAEVTSRAVDFLRSAFAHADPDGGAGLEALTELLHGAALEIERSFPDSSRARGLLLSVLGGMDLALGEQARGGASLERAYQDLRAALGPGHPGTLQVARTLALAWIESGRLADAERLLLEVEERLAQQRPEAGAELAATWTELAECAGGFGRWEEAENRCRQALAAWARCGRSATLDAARTWNQLAELHLECGRLEEALDGFQQAAGAARAEFGESHPAVAAYQANRALALAELGRGAEAAALLLELQQELRRRLGSDHPKVLASMGTLGAVYLDLGQLEQAEDWLAQAATAALDRYGAEHPRTLDARNNLALLRLEQERVEEGLALLEEVAAGRGRALGTAHRDTLAARGNLVIALDRAGRHGEAAAAARSLLEELRALHGPEHPEVLAQTVNLSLPLFSAGRYAEAAGELQAAREIALRVLGEGHLTSVELGTNLAFALEELGRAEEAGKMFQSVESAARRSLGPGHPQTRAALRNLALWNSWRGNHAAAAELARRVLELLPEDHPERESMEELLRAAAAGGR